MQSLAKVLSAGVDALIKFLQRIDSKKFFAWAVATHMTYIRLLDPQSWLLITLVWIGVQGALDWKGMPAATIVSAMNNQVPTPQSEPEVPPQYGPV